MADSASEGAPEAWLYNFLISGGVVHGERWPVVSEMLLKVGCNDADPALRFPEWHDFYPMVSPEQLQFLTLSSRTSCPANSEYVYG